MDDSKSIYLSRKLDFYIFKNQAISFVRILIRLWNNIHTPLSLYLSLLFYLVLFFFLQYLSSSFLPSIISSVITWLSLKFPNSSIIYLTLLSNHIISWINYFIFLFNYPLIPSSPPLSDDNLWLYYWINNLFETQE